MTNQKKSSVISRLNSNWEATVTLSLPLPVLNKIAQKAAKAGRKPVDYMKLTIVKLSAEKESL